MCLPRQSMIPRNLRTRTGKEIISLLVERRSQQKGSKGEGPGKSERKRGEGDRKKASNRMCAYVLSALCVHRNCGKTSTLGNTKRRRLSALARLSYSAVLWIFHSRPSRESLRKLPSVFQPSTLLLVTIVTYIEIHATHTHLVFKWKCMIIWQHCLTNMILGNNCFTLMAEIIRQIFLWFF